MTRLLLLRHADHAWVGRGLAGRMPEVALNAQGVEQARALVQRLAGEPLAAVYASPQPRAQQTARPLAAARQLEVRTAAEFDEVDFGEWTGLSLDHLREHGGAAWRLWCERRSAAVPPKGEPFEAVASRVLSGFRRLVREHRDETVAVVSHADVLRALVAQLLGMPLDALERIELAPASLTVVEAGADWHRLVRLNG